MKIFITVTTCALLLVLFFSPILILRRLDKQDSKYKLFFYLIISLIVSFVTMFIFAWWADTSNKILMEHYGYNFEGMDDTEKLANVSTENIKEVKKLKANRMGVGWPLRALMTYPFYLPYLVIVYVVIYLVNKFRRK